MTGAFDRVVPARLLHNMRERKIPDWSAKWVGSFISNRTTTLCLPGYNTDAFPTHTGIPQGSPLSPILFLFYNANLVEICNPPTLPASGTGFVYDRNTLAFGKSTEENCRTLQTVHERYLEWARRHGASFAPEKYVLVHFTKARTKHNHTCPLILPTSTIHPSPSARVLGVILDKKLSWQAHLQPIKSKLATQTNVLSRLTASTWGASLRVSRLLYTAVVRPAITTGCPAWWALQSTPFFRKGMGEELQKIENCCLSTVSGAYKATPVRSLQAEVGIPPLPLHMDGRHACFRLRSAESGIDRVIGEGILKVRQFLSCTRTCSRRPRTPGNRHTTNNPQPPVPPASDPAPLATLQLSWAQQRVPEDDPRRLATISTRANRKINALWLQQWQSSAKSPPNPDLVEAPPGTDVLKLPEGLQKAESSLAIQLRTGVKGLDAFLFQARVPSVPSPLGSCGGGRQTAKQVLILCPRHSGARHELRDEQGHLPNFSKLLGTAEGLRKTTKWVMQRGILGQFRGARDLLYGSSLSLSPALD
jgi:hypothetical protein